MSHSIVQFTEQEVTAIRRDTPGLQQVVHFNNAGAALMPKVVAQKVMDYINHELMFGGYETAEKFEDDISKAYGVLGEYLHCGPHEIAIMENATVAWGQAFQSVPLKTGDVILTSMSEYASNYIAFLQMKNRLGVDIEAIPNDQYGQLDTDALEKMIRPGVKLISVTHVPTNGGLVNPVAKIGAIAKKHNLWYLLDACQSVGQMPLDVKEIGCDFLSATSRKFLRGPRGVGFLYVNDQRLNLLEPPLLDLHGASWESPTKYLMRDDARRFENWENNLAGIAGMAVAVQYALDLGMDRIWNRIQFLAENLRSALGQIPGIDVRDLGKTKCGIVSFTSPTAPFKLKKALHQGGYNVSVISANGTLLDMNQRGLDYMIRASVHYYNTVEEIDQFVEFLSHVIVKN